MRRPAADYPEVVFSLDNCVVPAAFISSCLRGVQSYVRNPEFKLGAFFAQHTMDCVPDAISGARVLISASSNFNPWSRVCMGDRVECNATASCSKLTLIAGKRSLTSDFGLLISVYVLLLLMLVYFRHRLVVVRHVGARLLLGVFLLRRLPNVQFRNRQKVILVDCYRQRLQRRYQRNSQVVPLSRKNDDFVILC